MLPQAAVWWEVVWRFCKSSMRCLQTRNAFYLLCQMFQVSVCAWMRQAVIRWGNKILQGTFAVSNHEMHPNSFSHVLKRPDVLQREKITSSPPANVGMKIKGSLPFLPLWLKSPSISMEDLEWAIQSMEQGTMPSWAGERSVVRTRHQSGLSWSRSRTSTVWPRRTVSSPLLLPLLATKSWITTVNSQPPDSWSGRRIEMMSGKIDACLSTNECSLHRTLCEDDSYPTSHKTK